MCLFIPSVSFEGNEPVSCQDTIMWKIFLIFNVLFTDTDLGTSRVSSRTSQHRILSWNIPLKILFQASINSFWRRHILNSSLNKSHFTLLQSAKASFQILNMIYYFLYSIELSPTVNCSAEIILEIMKIFCRHIFSIEILKYVYGCFIICAHHNHDLKFSYLQ